MYPSIYIDDILIEQLKKHLELIFNRIKSINENSNLTNNLINKIHIDINQRAELCYKSYYEKFSLLIHDRYLIISNKKYFQFSEKQYYYFKQFFNKIFNIQSLNNIDQYYQQYEQSIQCFNQLKYIVQQYENDLNRLKEKLLEQNQQINIYSTNLFQIQFEQNQILLNIQQLKQEILFNKRLHIEIQLILKFTDINQESMSNNNLLKQLDTEYINLSTQITQIKFNIEQKSIDLLPLQFELYIYYTILNVTDIDLKDQSTIQSKLSMEIISKSKSIKSK